MGVIKIAKTQAASTKVTFYKYWLDFNWVYTGGTVLTCFAICVRAADVCGFCRKPVALTEPAIEALNRTYHDGCFQCRSCHCPLAGKQYYNKAGIPLCADCYQVKSTQSRLILILLFLKLQHKNSTYIHLNQAFRVLSVELDSQDQY